MGRFIDLTGKQFGRLTVIKDTGKKQGAEHLWECKCECGNTLITRGVNLREGSTQSCGCLKQESDKKPKGNVIDMIGQKYGHLTVIARAGSDKYGQALWECECDCGNPQHIVVLGGNLRKGHTVSCGCEKMSHGELIVNKLLTENNIPFER